MPKNHPEIDLTISQNPTPLVRNNAFYGALPKATEVSVPQRHTSADANTSIHVYVDPTS